MKFINIASEKGGGLVFYHERFEAWLLCNSEELSPISLLFLCYTPGGCVVCVEMALTIWLLGVTLVK